MGILRTRGWLRIVIGFTMASTAIAAGVGPFGIEVFGNFKRMTHSGDASGTVKLSDISGRSTTYGIGALAGLRGEVLLWDGRIMVSRGHDREGRVEPAVATDEAALMVIASVARWEEVDIPMDMTQAQFEAFATREAGRRGLAGSAPFPFAIKGEFSRVRWHVVTGAAGSAGVHGGGSHAQGHAQNRVFDQRDVSGVALGFYSGDDLEGVISHPGERFHVHAADLAFTRSGHIDEYAVRKGAKLLLPLRLPARATVAPQALLVGVISAVRAAVDQPDFGDGGGF